MSTSKVQLRRFMESQTEKSSAKPIPAYLKRQGFRPEEFGDGGAFPEIHVLQYPLGLGKCRSNKTLFAKVDAHGNVVFNALVMQNENSNKIVYSQHKHLIPKILKNNEGDLEDDEELKKKQIKETTEATKAALDLIVNVGLSAAQPKNVLKQSRGSKFIKYKPSQQCGEAGAFNSGAKERIVRMMEKPVDPLDVSKFKHKRVPRASGSPPVPVMHSPPRPVTAKDKQDFNIPSCISNSKNAKGYTIPLDKRSAADGGGLQDVQISDGFAKFSEALDVAEQKAREAVSMRSEVKKEMAMKEKERKEQELRALAQKARAQSMPSESVDPVGRGKGTEEREKIREERRKERKREKRFDSYSGNKKKSKITRDRERDVSEKVALGMASTGGGGGEVLYDQRLFNQEKGMNSGFAATDDQYNVYDKGLFAAQPTLSTLYKPKKDMDDEMYGNADELKNTERFKPDKAFSGEGSSAGKRERPVEITEEDEEDPFGLAQCQWVRMA